MSKKIKLSVAPVVLYSTLFILAPRYGWALSFDETTEVGSQTFIQSVSGLDTFWHSQVKKPAAQDKAQWNLGYSFDKTKSVDPVTGVVLTDQTSAVNGGLTWKDHRNWSLAAGLNYSDTPDESLKALGPQVSISYKYKFKRPSPAGKPSDFSPSITTRLLASRLNYTESFSPSKAKGRRKNIKPTTGKSKITQSLLRAEVSGEATEWLSAGASVGVYGYNRDVSQFLTYLDSPRAVNGAGAGGLSSTVSGFPSSDQSVDLQFLFAESWDFLAKYTRSFIASDHSQSSALRGDLSDDLSDSWTASVGVEYDHLIGFNETMGILSVGYSF
jgi:hypothetical protein